MKLTKQQISNLQTTLSYAINCAKLDRTNADSLYSHINTTDTSADKSKLLSNVINKDIDSTNATAQSIINLLIKNY